MRYWIALSAIVLMLGVAALASAGFGGSSLDGRDLALRGDRMRQAQPAPVRVLWDAAHDSRHNVANYSVFIDILRQYGHSVELLDWPIDEWTLADVDLFIVNDPRLEYTTDEVRALLHFVEDGGGLWIMGEWYPHWEHAEVVNAFLAPMRILVDKDEVPGDYTLSLADHPIAYGVDAIQFWDSAPLTLSGDAMPLVEMGADTLVAVNDFGCGRVLVQGDEIIVSQYIDWLFREDNLQYGLNAVEWLANGDDCDPCDDGDDDDDDDG